MYIWYISMIPIILMIGTKCDCNHRIWRFVPDLCDAESLWFLDESRKNKFSTIFDFSHIWSLLKRIARTRLLPRLQSYLVLILTFISSLFGDHPCKILSDGLYYLSISNALVNCPHHILLIMLIFNIVAIYKDWILNKKIFETYRSSKTGNPTIDPLNGVSEDELQKDQCSAEPNVRRLIIGYRCSSTPLKVCELWRRNLID